MDYMDLCNFLWSTIITHIKYVPDLFDIIVNKAACYYPIYKKKQNTESIYLIR